MNTAGSLPSSISNQNNSGIRVPKSFFMGPIVFVIIGILGAVAVILILRQNLQKSNKKITARAEKRHASPKLTSRTGNPYRAISIVCGQNSCAAVKAIGSKRFLIEDSDVPLLPLTECDAENCACKYIHREDRREEGERRTISGQGTERHLISGKVEQREKRGRRKSDSA